MNSLSDTPWRWIPLALLGLTLAFVGAAALGWLPQEWRSCRSMAVMFGLFTLSGTVIQPAWFWNSRKARRARAVFGDRVYGALLSGLALMLLYMGFFGTALDGCTVN